MAGPAAHPPRGPQLADGLGPFPGAIGHETDCLADDGHPAAPRPRRAGVHPGQVGIVVGEAAGGDQVAGDEVRVVLAEAAQVPAHLRVELRRRSPLRNLGPDLADVLRAAPRATDPIGVRATGSRSARRPAAGSTSAGWAGAIRAPRRAVAIRAPRRAVAIRARPRPGAGRLLDGLVAVRPERSWCSPPVVAPRALADGLAADVPVALCVRRAIGPLRPGTGTEEARAQVAAER